MEKLLNDTYVFKCRLPWPPSVNALYGGGSGQQRFMTKEYKQWKASCPTLQQLNLDQPCVIIYKMAFPDNRIRDGQNYMKAPLDYLVSQKVLKDDNRRIVIGEYWHTIVTPVDSDGFISIVIK